MSIPKKVPMLFLMLIFLLKCMKTINFDMTCMQENIKPTEKQYFCMCKSEEKKGNKYIKPRSRVSSNFHSSF